MAEHTIRTPNGSYTFFEKDGVTVRSRLDWNPQYGPRATTALQRTQVAFSQEVARKMDPYVPFDRGVLKSSVILASDLAKGELVYATPYARRQYYLHPMGSHVHDGKRGSYWGQRCIADNKAHFSSFAKGYFRKEMGR